MVSFWLNRKWRKQVFEEDDSAEERLKCDIEMDCSNRKGVK